MAYVIRKTILRNLNYVQYLNIVLIEKVWFMTPAKYSSNEKSIMAPVGVIVFRSGNRHGKKLKNTV